MTKLSFDEIIISIKFIDNIIQNSISDNINTRCKKDNSHNTKPTYNRLGTNYFYKRSNHEERAVKINHKKIVNLCVQSTASEYLTVPTIQKSILQDRPPKQQEETYVALPIHQLTKPLKKTNSTSTDVCFTGAWCHRIVAKH